tara:strand:+ start:464 stop:664 length:201 start_codon:yes stop_codon:yes gene_type:complete
MEILPKVCVHNTHKCVLKDGSNYSENLFGTFYSTSHQIGYSNIEKGFPNICDNIPGIFIKTLSEAG